MCHLLLMVPIAIAALFWFLPWSTAMPVAAVLGTGTVIAVALSWRAMRRAAAIGREAMIGRRGRAVSDMNPEGLVSLRGELWLAEAGQVISKGHEVEVVGVSGAKLRVRPWS